MNFKNMSIKKSLIIGFGTTIIMATHASQYVNIMRRRVVTLVDGKMAGDVQHGKYGDIV